jgi:hypothetical protein
MNTAPSEEHSNNIENQRKIESFLEKFMIAKKTHGEENETVQNDEPQSPHSIKHETTALTPEDLELLDQLQQSMRIDFNDDDDDADLGMENDFDDFLSSAKPTNEIENSISTRNLIKNNNNVDMARSSAEVRNLRLQLKEAQEALSKSAIENINLKNNLVKMRNFKTNVVSAQKNSTEVLKKLKSQLTPKQSKKQVNETPTTPTKQIMNSRSANST